MVTNDGITQNVKCKNTGGKSNDRVCGLYKKTARKYDLSTATLRKEEKKEKEGFVALKMLIECR